MSEECHGHCGCGHEETPLPRTFLVAASGVLTGTGLLIGWTAFGPAWLETLVFAIATLAGGLLVFPLAWKALLALRLDMN
ncbi:MAG: hypothetical protein EOP88_23575, partial [Verrucomicrobiaceae bacterium]